MIDIGVLLPGSLNLYRRDGDTVSFLEHVVLCDGLAVDSNEIVRRIAVAHFPGGALRQMVSAFPARPCGNVLHT